MSNSTQTPSESKIQQEIVKYYRNTYCLKHHDPRCMLFSVPNEGRGAQSALLVQTGLMAGVSDLVVLHVKQSFPDTYEETILLFVEVKTDEGRQSPKQKDFEARCRMLCVNYHIVRSLEDFKQVIEKL